MFDGRQVRKFRDSRLATDHPKALHYLFLIFLDPLLLPYISLLARLLQVRLCFSQLRARVMTILL